RLAFGSPRPTSWTSGPFLGRRDCHRLPTACFHASFTLSHTPDRRRLRTLTSTGKGDGHEQFGTEERLAPGRRAVDAVRGRRASGWARRNAGGAVVGAGCVRHPCVRYRRCPTARLLRVEEPDVQSRDRARRAHAGDR